MPQTYTVTDPSTGRKVKLTGDSPPTEAELTEIFARVNGAPMPPATPPAAASPQQGIGALATIGDFAAGLGKSAAGVIEGGGKLLRQIPGVDAASRAIGEVSLPFTTAPSNATQAAGKMTGDVAQFFTPTGVIGKGAKLAEIGKSIGLTLLQTGSPTAAGVSGALTALIPGAAGAKKASEFMERGAQKSLVRALGPTKEAMKDKAMSLAGEALDKGVKGSRPQMLQQARAATSHVGQSLQSEIGRLASEGKAINGERILEHINAAADSMLTHNADGMPVIIEGMQPVLKQLDKLHDFVTALGPTIPFDKAAAVKQAWDKIVDKAGLFGAKATSSATDNAKAWAFREASGSFRKAMAETGGDTYQALNKEYAFWKGLRSVLAETERRTQSHGAGLTAGMMGTAGAGVGMLSGDSLGDRLEKAALGAMTGSQMTRLLQSPQFATRVSAPLKHRLADALASDSAANIAMAFRAVMASLPSDVRTALETK